MSIFAFKGFASIGLISEYNFTFVLDVERSYVPFFDFSVENKLLEDFFNEYFEISLEWE